MRRPFTLVAALALSIAGLTACSDGTPSDTQQPEPPAQAQEPSEAANTPEPAPGGSEGEMVPVPEGTFPQLTEFPIPPGASVTTIDAVEGRWLFDVVTSDVESVSDFYERVLPELGFVLAPDATITMGQSTTEPDVAFKNADSTIVGGVIEFPELGFASVNLSDHWYFDE